MPANILVVEDNRDNLDLIDYLLRAYGFTPLLAASGVDGIRIALAEHPDLILLDIRMPGMDGYEVAAAIHDVPGLERTRIVAVTASAMVGDRERIATAGFDGYIQKPIDPETFMMTLEQFLPEPRVGVSEEVCGHERKKTSCLQLKKEESISQCLVLNGRARASL